MQNHWLDHQIEPVQGEGFAKVKLTGILTMYNARGSSNVNQSIDPDDGMLSRACESHISSANDQPRFLPEPIADHISGLADHEFSVPRVQEVEQCRWLISWRDLYVLTRPYNGGSKNHGPSIPTPLMWWLVVLVGCSNRHALTCRDGLQSFTAMVLDQSWKKTRGSGFLFSLDYLFQVDTFSCLWDSPVCVCLQDLSCCGWNGDTLPPSPSIVVRECQVFFETKNRN